MGLDSCAHLPHAHGLLPGVYNWSCVRWGGEYNTGARRCVPATPFWKAVVISEITEPMLGAQGLVSVPSRRERDEQLGRWGPVGTSGAALPLYGWQA